MEREQIANHFWNISTIFLICACMTVVLWLICRGFYKVGYNEGYDVAKKIGIELNQKCQDEKYNLFQDCFEVKK